MKKAIGWILCLILACVLGCGCSEGQDSFFGQLAEYRWTYSTEEGGWSTDLRIQPDGSFSGTYTNVETGENKKEYPDGTIYLCEFTGRLSLVEQADENTWKIRVDELKTKDMEAEEYINNGIRYVFPEPYGISEGDVMTLLRPGIPAAEIPEEVRALASLAYVSETDDTVEVIDENSMTLNGWFLYSARNASGFAGYLPD